MKKTKFEKQSFDLYLQTKGNIHASFYRQLIKTKYKKDYYYLYFVRCTDSSYNMKGTEYEVSNYWKTLRERIKNDNEPVMLTKREYSYMLLRIASLEEQLGKVWVTLKDKPSYSYLNRYKRDYDNF